MEELKGELAKGVGNLMGDLYKDGPKDSYQQVFKAFGGVVEWALQKTYILRLANEKRRLEFERNMQMLKDSMGTIPEQKVVEVAPEISVPLLEKLSYTSNENIAKLFVNLLTKASNEETVDQAHPAFVSMIERMSSDEAKILKYLRGMAYLLYVNIKFVLNEQGIYNYHMTYITELHRLDLDFKKNIPSYLSNLVGMGVLADEKPTHKSDLTVYDPIKELVQPTFDSWEKLLKQSNPDQKVEWEHSFFQITDFGQLFLRACTVSPRFGAIVTS